MVRACLCACAHWPVFPRLPALAHPDSGWVDSQLRPSFSGRTGSRLGRGPGAIKRGFNEPSLARQLQQASRPRACEWRSFVSSRYKIRSNVVVFFLLSVCPNLLTQFAVFKTCMIELWSVGTRGGINITMSFSVSCKISHLSYSDPRNGDV